MVIGVCRITLFIHDCQSLKDKRQVLKSIIGKVKNHFNVAIAETGDNDVWQRAELGFCTLGNDKSCINSAIDKVLGFIEGLHMAEVTDHNIELINC